MKEQLIELANSGLNLDLFYSIRVHKGSVILQGHLNAETLQALNEYHFTFDNETQQIHSTDYLEFTDLGHQFRIVLV